MNLQQSLNKLELDTIISDQFQYSTNIHTRQMNRPQTHGGRLDFSFPLKFIPIIISNVDTHSLLNFTVVELGAGDATLAIIIWLIFHPLFQQTPRIIGTEKDHNCHAVSEQ